MDDRDRRLAEWGGGVERALNEIAEQLAGIRGELGRWREEQAREPGHGPAARER